MRELDLKSYDVVSFDIFDTLLLRAYLKPTDVFEQIEAKLGCVGFSLARQNADSESVRLALAAERDATIDDAYLLMPETFRGLRASELEFEREGLTANAEMVAIWRRTGELGKKRIISSDMYLPRLFLEEVLRENGIDGWDGFYLSNERGRRKSDGKLYEQMLEEVGVAAERILHIGDNAESDVAVPQRMGMSAILYERVAGRVIAENPFLLDFLGVNGSLTARRLVASVSIAWHNYVALHACYPYWARIGGLIGGVLAAAYVAFLVKKVQDQKIDRVLFVARDGYVLEKLFNEIAPQIRTNYVYAPRLVKNSEDQTVHSDYAAYVRGLGIGTNESVAVVDSVSWHFSAQKLIAEVLGRNVFAFSLIALSKSEDGDCFIFAPKMSLRWCNLAEQLFMANEPPIVAVKNGCPVYKSSLLDPENKRLKVFAELMEAEMEVARYLLLKHIEIAPVLMLDYIDSFLSSMTEEDEHQFSLVKNDVEIGGDRCVSLLDPPHWETTWRTFRKIPVYRRCFRREGLKNVIRDYFLGFCHFRTTVEDL